MSTFQPPVHLDPTQDPAQQTAFINQNFQTLASALETNSFRIVQSGSTTLDATSVIQGNTVTNTIAHGLSFVPIPLAFVSNSGFYYPLPTYSAISYGAAGAVAFNNWLTITTDATNVYISIYISGASGNWGTWPVQYYLLQQTAS